MAKMTLMKDGYRLFFKYLRQFMVVKMPTMSVTKALYESKGCLVYPYNRHLNESYLAS